MIVRQASAVRTVIGGDPHRGWLPLGASEPLPAAPEPGWLDVRVALEAGQFVLSWHPHEPSHLTLPSAQGERRFGSLEEADAAAKTLFGLGPDDWVVRAEGKVRSEGSCGC